MINQLVLFLYVYTFLAGVHICWGGGAMPHKTPPEGAKLDDLSSSGIALLLDDEKRCDYNMLRLGSVERMGMYEGFTT